MPTVLFNPSGSTIDVPPGTNLLEAANLANISTEIPCGGRGVCGKCLVKVLSGKAEVRGFGHNASLSENMIPICKSYVLDEPITLEIASSLSSEEGKFSDIARDMALIDPVLLSSGSDVKSLVECVTLNVAAPRMADGLSDYDRFAAAFRDAAGLTPCVPLPLLRELPALLRKKDGEVSAAYYADEGNARIVTLSAVERARYGIAADIGTTTVALTLVELSSGAILASRTDYNAQIECGLDIINRINYAHKPERLLELRTRVLGTLNKLIASASERCGISQNDIVAASISANMTMVHLFMGIVPEYIRLDPYTPAVYNVPVFSAGELGLELCANAPVSIAPSVGSYVGGDITAGLLCTSLATESEELALFIDIGTNGEIVLGNNEFLIGCACSAGPAFEGGGMRYGMRASKGAIERMEITDGTLNCFTIGNVPPTGICGSGMISIVAGLFRAGLLDPAGKLDRDFHLVEADGKNARINIARDENGQMIFVTEADIDNLIRAKAAIFSACCMLLESVGMAFGDISKFYIAGGFGRYLDIGDAKTIGLIPNLPEKCFRFIGNSSQIGSYMTLVSQSSRALERELAGKITYLDLSAEPGYMNQYTAALFLPHTDLSLFT